MLFPELADLDALAFSCGTLNSHPLLVSVVHNLSQVLRMYCVKYVVKVLSGRPFVLREGIREELHELRVLLELREKSFDC